MQKNLLIVDDEPAIIKGLKFSLEQDGYNIVEAYDGQEAVDKFFSEEFDLVVLDVMLPEVEWF